MPSLNYNAQFAPLVQSGQKLHTIRTLRRKPIKAGDQLYHYTGMRTIACRLLGVSTCTESLGIDIIMRPSIDPRAARQDILYVFLQMAPGGGQRRLGNIEISVLAIADGFTDTDAFFSYFLKDTDNFTGHLIKWTEISPF